VQIEKRKLKIENRNVRPLSPWLYFRRNPGKTLPVSFVIVIAVALVACVVSLVDSIDLTVLTMYGYNRYFTVVTPRNSLVVAEDIAELIRKQPLTGEMYRARPAFTVVKTIFGKMPFVVFGIGPDARRVTLLRCGLHLHTGRLPVDGAAELALSEEIARNRKLKLGDVVLKPDSEDSYSVVPMRLVGTLKGSVWLALTSEQFIREHFMVSPQGFLIMAKDPAKQDALDVALEKSVDKSRARIWTYRELVRETKDALSSLYLIMATVIGIIVFAIAFLTGMLANIYFTQRLPEFATLSAIGYQRSTLLWRVFNETAILSVTGWVLGSALTFGVLQIIKAGILTPRGLLLDPYDIAAYRYTLPLPISISGFALVAIGGRLRRLDPVAIIERRQ
jgi:ABC-type lipoprotein release transport system permease subunit